jgi:hypothetical protein
MLLSLVGGIHAFVSIGGTDPAWWVLFFALSLTLWVCAKYVSRMFVALIPSPRPTDRAPESKTQPRYEQPAPVPTEKITSQAKSPTSQSRVPVHRQPANTETSIASLNLSPAEDRQAIVHNPDSARTGETKICPYCAEVIKAAAVVCPFCRCHLQGAIISPKGQGRGLSILEALFVTLGVLMLGVFLQIVTNFPMIAVMIVTTSIWAASDATKIGLHKYRLDVMTSSVTTLLGCLLLWIVCFPWYLANKGKIQRGEAELKERFASEGQRQPSGCQPTSRQQSASDSSMSIVKIGIGVCLGGLLLTFAGCVACSLLITTGQRQTERQAGTEAPFITTAEELYGAYVANQVAADSKYRSHSVIVSGIIRSIGKDITNQAYIVIGGRGFLDGVQCSFSASEEAAIATLSQGQNVAVKGRVAGKMGNVLLQACTLQPMSKAGSIAATGSEYRPDYSQAIPEEAAVRLSIDATANAKRQVTPSNASVQSPEAWCRAIAEREYPNDPQLQQFTYNQQMAAYRYMATVEDADVEQIALREYPEDFALQKFTYDQQIAAKRYMAAVTDAEVKQIALREYPSDYALQKFTFDQQIAAKRYMAAVTDAEVKQIALSEYPSDYALQKFTYDQQIAAKRYMAAMPDSLAKRQAMLEYPRDYALQKFAYDRSQRGR